MTIRLCIIAEKPKRTQSWQRVAGSSLETGQKGKISRKILLKSRFALLETSGALLCLLVPSGAPWSPSDPFLGSPRFSSVLLGSPRFFLGSPRFFLGSSSVLLGSSSVLLGSPRFSSVLLGSPGCSALILGNLGQA